MRGRGRQRDDADFVEVEITDAAAEPPQSQGPGDHGAPTDEVAPAPPPAPRRRRRVSLAVAATAAVALFVVGVNLVEVVRARAEAAAVAGVDGLVAAMPEAPSELWSLTDGVVIAETAELLLVHDNGNGRLRGIRAQDGTVAWDRPPRPVEPGDFCQPWYDGTSNRVELLMCTDDGYVVGLPVEGARTAIETVDAATGQTVGRVEVEGAVVTTLGEDGAMIAVTVDSEGRVHVTSLDPRTGAEAWHHRGPPGMVEDPQGVSSYVSLGRLHLSAYDIASTDGAEVELMTLDTRTGEPVAATEREDVEVVSEERELPDGGVLEVTAGPDGGSVVVSDGDAVRFEAEGWPWDYTVDDRSAPDVLVLMDETGQPRGLDARTGEVRWTLEVEGFMYAMARLRGVAVVTGFESTQAVDLRSGEVLWTLEQMNQGYGVVTDGRRVLVTDGAGGALVAHDLHDGREVWRMPISASAYARGVDGVLVVEDESGLTAYG